MPTGNDGSAGVVFMAFVMGAVAGAAAALLWEPSTREEARRLLNDRAREGRERATVAAQRGREFVEKQREHLSTAVDRGREAYQRARDTPEDASEEHG